MPGRHRAIPNLRRLHGGCGCGCCACRGRGGCGGCGRQPAMALLQKMPVAEVAVAAATELALLRKMPVAAKVPAESGRPRASRAVVLDEAVLAALLAPTGVAEEAEVAVAAATELAVVAEGAATTAEALRGLQPRLLAEAVGPLPPILPMGSRAP